MSITRRKTIENEGLLFCEFISEKEALGLSKKSIQNYKDVYARFVSEVGTRISDNSIQTWIHSMINKGMNPVSINFYISQIRVFSNWLILNKFCTPFNIKKIKTQEPQLKTVSEEDISKLLERPPVNSSFVMYRTWVIISFIMGTGARASTITDIRIEDIDFYRKEIKYRHLKNKTSAIIPLSQSLEIILKRYLSTWDIGNNFLFPDKNGGELSLNALTHSIRRYCIQRGVRPRGAHSFRHTFAKKYILNGGNAFTLQKLLTHTDLSMTKKYVRLFDSDLKASFDSLCPLENYIKRNITKKE